MNQEQENTILNKKNVIGIGHGNKWIGGKNTGQEALLIFVERKEDISKLHPNDVIPKEINGKITDVVGKCGELMPLVLSQKIRPVTPGYSCGHVDVTAGTIGGFFMDKNNEIVGLTNNHVGANNNLARIGSYIIQPGRYDNPNYGNNIIGTLKNFKSLNDRDKTLLNVYLTYKIGRKIKKTKIKSGLNFNLEDSAIFRTNTQIEKSIPTIGKIKGFNYFIGLYEKVQKTGRTTEYNTGTIISVSTTIQIRYDNSVLTFRDQLVTTAMAQGGDSGSLLCDMSGNVTGLLFAGSNSITIHNKIIYPVSTYGLKILN
jgi:hypothetical protein